MTKSFDERNALKSRKVCAAMAERADTGKRKLTERERQILDMWPRFEDGEFNDETGIVGGNLDIVRRAKALAGIEVD